MLRLFALRLIRVKTSASGIANINGFAAKNSSRGKSGLGLVLRIASLDYAGVAWKEIAPAAPIACIPPAPFNVMILVGASPFRVAEASGETSLPPPSLSQAIPPRSQAAARLPAFAPVLSIRESGAPDRGSRWKR
jgi:hypothetical protein